MNLDLRIFIPKSLFTTSDFERVIELSLDEVTASIIVDFKVTTQTWNHKVIWQTMKEKGIRQVYTDDRIYFFLNFGTRVRYATMSSNFRPKSRVGAIRSNKGSGGLLYISKRRPRPGIAARKWDEAIQKKWEKEYPDLVQRAIDSEASRQIRRSS